MNTGSDRYRCAVRGRSFRSFFSFFFLSPATREGEKGEDMRSAAPVLANRRCLASVTAVARPGRRPQGARRALFRPRAAPVSCGRTAVGGRGVGAVARGQCRRHAPGVRSPRSYGFQRKPIGGAPALEPLASSRPGGFATGSSGDSTMTDTRARTADTAANTVGASGTDADDEECSAAFATAEDQLDTLLAAFRTGEVEGAVEKTLLEPAAGDERPIDSWSLSNRLLCYLAGTQDARGYRQWQEVGRHVEEGASAIRILVPKTVTVEEEVEREDGTVATEERERCVGFYAAPVFRVEDTAGEPLPDPDYRPPALPPLADVADAMGVAIQYDAARGKGAYGSFDPDADEITLFTHDEQTFWHELAHAAHHRVSDGLERGQDPEQEAVAELAAAVLARLYGASNDGHSFDYLAHYAERDGAGDVYRLCLSVIGEVEEVLRYILEQVPEGR